MPIGFADCINSGERWGGTARQMTNISCLPSRIDGIQISPCISCRLVLKREVDKEGRLIAQPLVRLRKS